MRHVYGDFLEERGDVARATIVRMPNAATFDPEAPLPVDQARWRALVTDAPIQRCHLAEVRRGGENIVVPSCDRRWRTARPTDDVLVRACTVRFTHRDGERVQSGCGYSIHYCTSIEDVASAGAARASIVLDPALDVAIATATYDANAHGPPVDDDNVDPIAPGPAPEIIITRDEMYEGSLRGGLLSRIRDFFRR
jgi:hypothetical protein